MYAERFDAGDQILEASNPDGVKLRWSFSALLDRADGDLDTAIRLASGDITGAEDR